MIYFDPTCNRAFCNLLSLEDIWEVAHPILVLLSTCIICLIIFWSKCAHIQLHQGLVRAEKLIKGIHICRQVPKVPMGTIGTNLKIVFNVILSHEEKRHPSDLEILRPPQKGAKICRLRNVLSFQTFQAFKMHLLSNSWFWALRQFSVLTYLTKYLWFVETAIERSN